MDSKYGVHRVTDLPAGELRGEYTLSEPMITATRNALVSFALLGIRDCGHEGIVFWAGREAGPMTAFTTVIVPDAEHAAQRVYVNKESASACAKAARSCQLGLLCQVHSHPGSDARHSSGDDEMIFMPFEGMLSIVVPNYGIGFDRISQACIHQFQDHRWVLCSRRSVGQRFHMAPTIIDLR